ncbi:DUF4150 domain-containing protein [Roseateles chitinivorans]|uniref:DUF4150 domain-containing protein n=1 Tax=Roseateles chitinivorans TaxID=2917965 RepID=UPI003D667653
MATIPDVCKTPSPGGPVPIPYPNIAQSVTLSDGTTTVKGDRAMAAIKGSKFAMSNGDNPGTLGGVKSSTFMKEATWILYSFDVKMNGKGCARLSDKMFHNHENAANLGGEFQIPKHLEGRIDQDMFNLLCDSVKATRKKADEGKIPSDKYPTLQSYMAKRHSSGFPLFEPKRADLLVEATWKIPKQIGGAFKCILSKERFMGLAADGVTKLMSPANFWRGLSAGRGAPGTTFRPDFTVLSKANGGAKFGNVKSFVEIKFKGDTLTKNQLTAKRRAGKQKFVEIKEEDCKEA